MMLPLQTFDLVQATEGQALLIIGLLAMLLAASVLLRNPAGVVAWGITVIMMLLSVVLNLGSEWMWISAIATAMLVLIGAVVRWMG